MDNWGDPWADHTDAYDDSPTKPELASLPPAASAAPPALLNVFVDDAGWGNSEGDAFGAWATSPGTVVRTPIDTGTSAPVSTATEDALSSVSWDKVEHREGEKPTTLEHGETVSLGTSTSSPATLQQWTSPEQPLHSTPWDTIQDGEGETVECEEEYTTEHRHGDAAEYGGGDSGEGDGKDTVEQEERNTAKCDEDKGPDDAISGTSDAVTTKQPHDASPPVRSQPDDDLSTRASTSPSETSHNDAPAESSRTSFEEEGAGKVTVPHQEHHETEPNAGPDKTIDEPRSVDSDRAPDLPTTTTGQDTTQDAAASRVFSPDMALVADLFPSPSTAEDLHDAPEDPIYSTTARKAWYRLTRKQTMREHNAGYDQDNYIRVTWANSHVRLEANKIVGRWAREDRISGTGAGARASFYWDTTAPVDLATTRTHVRNKTSTPTSNPIAPARHSLPPLPTNASVAFDWSSPSAQADPWQHHIPALPSTSSPSILKHAAITNAQKHGSRSMSADLTPYKHGQATHISNSSPPPVSFPTMDSRDPWANLGSLDTKISREESASAQVDDDDDWGEMIQSPAVSVPPQSFGAFPDTAYASPIVPLGNIISPTSGSSQRNSFVSPSIEHSPIGSSTLELAKDLAVSTPETNILELSSPLPSETKPGAREQNTPEESGNLDEFFAWKPAVPISVSETTKDDHSSKSASTTSLAAPSSTNPPVDSWADADFSIFESSVPSQPPASQQHASDSFSILTNPAAEEPAQPVSHSSPNILTSTPPLTGITNSATRRKADEDQIVKDIVGGLPDLMYMLL
ncbi:hypothetical protein P153DRAFT_370129 [Dothidotthia symphoricarpi CBS 119687]|uniref:Uncharacterized protein n=1 Tax=Dothidotthia symphoricarpi CBS 119687 TaxID=1392245 RepID=A0A6A6A4F0_9PLEO|nr:uncharacterized protein P153DRAFT_370129 [Dothidotthia symphoricarpi CBS 119687]KAF2125471.1 hypothetical protein P153DRAFT_370129 [Dothidotthia symphoricarpi CBS 119687]